MARAELGAALAAGAVIGCEPGPPPEPIVSDPLTPTSGGDGAGEVVLPSLRRMGRLAPDTYLFRASALPGEPGDALRPAELIEVLPDAFVVSVDGGPHRAVPRREGWPMACLRAPLDIEEGDLAVRLDEGTPVLVLASSSGGARVSVALDMEHSEVVHPTALEVTEGCEAPPLEAADRRVAEPEEGDRACLFGHQETLDETAGLAIPSGVGATVRETDGEWARVRVALPGGYANGWLAASLLEDAPSVRALDAPEAAALGPGRCLFPGRSDREANIDPLALEDDPAARPMIPPEAVERVFAQGRTQIEACYAPRLAERPELAVDLEVLLLVDPDGRVDRIRLVRGAAADEALSDCVREVVRRWRFTPPRVGAVELRRTYRLRPPEPAPDAQPTP